MKGSPCKYKVLGNSFFKKEEYSIVPIRYEDRFDIMRWRNEQIYHLRQSKPLTISDQESYFRNIVSNLFDNSQPDQLLFSYLENRKCIGYGGLVHINWLDKNAEISFIMATSLEREHFYKHWRIYLSLIEKVAFEELNLHKIYTYAFDLRPHLYEAIERVGYKKEAVLQEHCFSNGEFRNVVIHMKMNRQIKIRSAKLFDDKITYEWANDKDTRKNSFSSEPIQFEVHKKWWRSKMDDNGAIYFIVEVKNQPAGIVRFDKSIDSDNFTIGINIAPPYRGQGISAEVLREACSEFFKLYSTPIVAYIKPENSPSIKSFEKVGFQFLKKVRVNCSEAFMYQLTRNEK